MAAGKRKENESFADYRARLKSEQQQMDFTKRRGSRLLFDSAYGSAIAVREGRKMKSGRYPTVRYKAA